MRWLTKKKEKAQNKDIQELKQIAQKMNSDDCRKLAQKLRNMIEKYRKKGQILKGKLKEV